MRLQPVNMSKQVYKWNRFWCPRSGSMNLADGGFLYDPDGEWGKAYNPDLVTFEVISKAPCLVLLGEPGIGKTHTIAAELHKIETVIQKQGDELLFLDLRSYGSEDRLVTDLFSSHEFTKWQHGSHQLYIFLDSLDECLLRIEVLSTLLIDKLRKYRKNIDRLHLRIACRTAVWQPSLEEGLKEIWERDTIEVYELAPLRRRDIVEAVETRGLSADEFIKEVERKEIVSLAIKPVTLEFLLNIYQNHNGRFPPNQKLQELYLEGCRQLCVEAKDKNRHPSTKIGTLDTEQRLIIAARIAAITIFANRFAVWTGERVDAPAEDVFIQQLASGREQANGRQFEITRRAIEEVLDTGLFSSRGLNRMGWAHQTYAEFLAAWYLEQHQISLPQIRELLFSSVDPDGRLIPQLHETAAWLAGMRIEVIQEILKTDSDVLLRSDVPTDANVRSAIVDSLLAQYEQEQLFDDGNGSYQRYEKLNHPELAAQLHPYLCNSNKSIAVRDLTIDLIKICKVVELEEELVNIALDSSQANDLRVRAVSAIRHMSERNIVLKLKPIISECFSEDVDDSLKGFVLTALWSNHLTATELFNILTKPKRQNHIGVYHLFINYKLVTELQPDDLVIALNWLEDRDILCCGSAFESLGEAIISKALENFEHPGVAENFARVAILYWRKYQKINIGDDFYLDFTKRRILIERLVSIISATEESSRFMFGQMHEAHVVSTEDVFWILDWLKSANDIQVQRTLSQLIEWIFNREDIDQIDAIINTTQTNEILSDIFAYYFTPIELDSPQAIEIKSTHYEIQESIARRQKFTRPLEPVPKERVLQVLENFEAGDLLSWHSITQQMLLNMVFYLVVDSARFSIWTQSFRVACIYQSFIWYYSRFNRSTTG